MCKFNQKGHSAMRTVRPEEDSTVVFPSPMTAGATTTCSWFQTYCPGQGCIDRSNPCKGRCWSQTAPILCGNNLCLSKYQLEVKKPVFSRSMSRMYCYTSTVYRVSPKLKVSRKVNGGGVSGVSLIKQT